MAPSLRAQVDRRLNLLAGKPGSLQYLELKNVPCRLNPSVFPDLISLSLAHGTRTTYTEVIAFLEISTKLHTLRLVDLTLVESLEQTGLIDLLYLIDVQNCNKLYLHTRATVELVGQRLAEKVVPVVRKALTMQPHTSLDIRRHLTSKEMFWRSQGDPWTVLEIRKGGSISGSTPAIRTVRTDYSTSSNGGAAPLTPSPGTIMAVPTLPTDSLQPLDITDISADVVEGYLGYVKDLLIKDLRPSFPRLGSVHLKYIPDAQAVVQPCSWAQYSLTSLLDDLRHVYQQLTAEEDLFEETGFVITFPHPLMVAGREASDGTGDQG
ncbi:hypothetical protein FS837_002255 [Tulasnella sp. UAMH 9824]|nr:hypothetical protein FS837_002255 [Tulasnella sp. UAMH 9824]